MLINLWYVAEFSRSITTQPKRVKLLGQHFVLFRDDEGNAHCLSDVCIHRGASLGKGTCKNSCVVCPYHGWSFSGDGRVVNVPPSSVQRKLPVQARVDSYPVEERYGWVWVFLGDDPPEKRLPIPEFPEFDDPHYAVFDMETIFDVDASRAVENAMDVMHVGTVHTSFGDPETVIELSNRKEFPGGASIQVVSEPPACKGHMKAARARKRRTTSFHAFYLSGLTIRTHVRFRNGWEQILFDAKTPVDEHTTHARTLCARTFFKTRLLEPAFKSRLRKVNTEDADVLSEVLPKRLPHKLDHEFSVREDEFQILFRKYKQRRIDRGDQIDLAKLRAIQEDEFLAIPSPGRHPNAVNNNKWIFDTVPTIPAKTSLARDSMEFKVPGRKESTVFERHPRPHLPRRPRPSIVETAKEPPPAGIK